MRSLRTTSLIAAMAITASLAFTALASGSLAVAMRPSPGGAAPGLTYAPLARVNANAALTADIVAARQATAPYATNLAAARAAGYQILTRMIPNMGYHFLNPKVKGFDVRKPPILVYEHVGAAWQLGALEWVFTSKPSVAPLPGAQYGSFPAACQYLDGTFVPESAQSMCPSKSPTTGAKFNFWHPPLVTLHFWVWFPNPSGLYSGMNPTVSPFNAG